jgi:hypothetical protein
MDIINPSVPGLTEIVKIKNDSSPSKLNSTVFEDDSTLIDFEIDTGKWALVTLFRCALGATGRLKWQWNEESGVFTQDRSMQMVSSADAVETLITTANALGSQILLPAATVAGTTTIMAWTTFACTTEGVLSLQYAQETAAVENCFLQEGSWARFTKMRSDT